MGEPMQVTGPVCDGCGEFAAIVSLMNLADYSQIRTCGNCSPDMLRTIADSMDGGHTAAAAEPEPADELAADTLEGALAAEPAGDDQADETEQGSARDHWASTTNVRRSTHGHRRPSSATGKPRESEPE